MEMPQCSNEICPLNETTDTFKCVWCCRGTNKAQPRCAIYKPKARDHKQTTTVTVTQDPLSRLKWETVEGRRCFFRPTNQRDAVNFTSSRGSHIQAHPGLGLLHNHWVSVCLIAIDHFGKAAGL